MNRRSPATLVLLILLALMVAATGVSASTDDLPARTLVHLLGYIAQDYSGAVAGGQILNAGEYNEQQELFQSARRINESLQETRGEPAIANDLQRLGGLIAAKGANDSVVALARSIQGKVIRVCHLEIAPATWPDLHAGAQLFARSCLPCHGVNGEGNGPAARTLTPPPANFHDEGRMGNISPFAAFNAIRIGVQGTSMPSFPALSDREAWDLAFYVVSLRYRNGAAVDTLQSDRGLPSTLTLQQVASHSDAELAAALSGTDQAKRGMLAAVRLHSLRENEASVSDVFKIARTNLQGALEDYRAGRRDEARNRGVAAYLEGVEPVEPRLKIVDAGLMERLERAMGNVRSSIERERPIQEVESAVREADDLLDEAESSLSHQPISPLLTVLVAGGIIMREGFEAVLIVIAVLGVLRAVGASSAAKWVHAGWISALGLGMLIWFVSGRLLHINGQGREVMEAVSSLVAVIVLLYMGFWLHNKTEITRWKKFVEERVRTALDGRNFVGLAAISFIAVFRESVESVVFLSALSIEGGGSTNAGIIAGVAGALLVVIALAWGLLRFSVKIPVKKLFAASSILMGGLAVVLAGKGAHAAQEAGWLPSSSLSLPIRWDFIGLYPTFETLGPQIIILVATILLWRYGRKPSMPRTA